MQISVPMCKTMLLGGTDVPASSRPEMSQHSLPSQTFITDGKNVLFSLGLNPGPADGPPKASIMTL